MTRLVIVESPGKIQKIKSLLGEGYEVAASMGHIRNLLKGLNSIDIDNNFKPTYSNIESKKKTINDLKAKAKKADEIIIASDLDREGEAIGYHICKCLGLDVKTTQRIVFTEITQKAINEAIGNPRTLDMDMVNAQQARQILDLLVGFEISPILWNQLENNKLSAGRCQSPALKLIIDREQTIDKFSSNEYFTSDCVLSKEEMEFEGEFKEQFKTKQEVINMLEEAKTAKFIIKDVKKSKSKHSSSAPFITSSLQQEASNKLNMNPKCCMEAAQGLYEKGKITYMRTDSTNISLDCIKDIESYVKSEYSDKYYKFQTYTKKIANSQEAHEAIRPVQISETDIDDDGSGNEKRLYKLIWKRTVASQMTDQKLDVYKINTLMNDNHSIMSSYDVETFDGYTILDKKEKEDYTDILELVNSLTEGNELNCNEITAEEKWTKSMGRYTEASLIKELEKLGIGRPSTYSNIVTTVQERNYVIKDTKLGVEKEMLIIKLKNDKISEKKKKKKTDGEKNKLFPTDLGKRVIEFMDTNFKMILNYTYTSDIEDELDNVSNGKSIWYKIVERYYSQFHPIVLKFKENKKMYEKQDNITLGDGIQLFKNKWGKTIKNGDNYINLDCFKDLKSKDLDNIKYDDIDYLLEFPISIGYYENNELIMKYGQHGMYFTYNGKNYSIKGDMDTTQKLKTLLRETPYEKCIELIKEGSKIQTQIYKEFKDILVKNGRYGPYIQNGKKNVSIPKNIDPNKITLEQCKTLLKQKK